MAYHGALLRLALAAIAGVLFSCTATVAQSGGSLDERLDTEEYLKGLADLELPEVLEHFIQTHPPADDVEAAMYEIARQRVRINAAVDAAARRDAIERLIAAREELINAHPGHPRRAVWRADQCSDLLFLLLPADATGVTAMFGVGTAEQTARAQRVARDMNRHMIAAETEIDRSLLDLESRPGFSDDIELQMRRRRLADNERDRRIPFFRGIGAALFAEFAASEDNQRREHDEIAASTLEPLLESLPGELADRAAIFLALARARLGDFDVASQLIDGVTTGGNVGAPDLFMARMIGALNLELNRTPDDALAALDGLRDQYRSESDVLYRVIIADRRFQLHQQLAEQATAAAADAHRLNAYRSYLDLLDADFGLPAETMEAIVFNRLAAVAGPGAPLDRLPPLVTIAVAQRMSEEVATRAEAIERFEAVLERSDLADRDRAAALFGLGRALYRNNRPIDAAERFTQLAARYPTDRRADSAIELAASIADAAYRETPDDPEARAALRETLALLLDRFSNLPSIDRWRYAAGRLEVDEKNYPRAIQHFNAIAADAPQRLDGLYMEAAAMRAQLRDQQNADQLASQLRISASALLESIGRARTALEQGLIREQDADRKDDLRWYLGYLRVYEAEAHLALNDGDAALEAVADIEREPGLEGSIIAQGLRARIDAYQLLGRTSDAAQEIERFLESAPEQAGDVITPLLATIINEVKELISISRGDEARVLAQEQLLPHAAFLEQWLQNAAIAEGRRRAVSFQLAEAFRYGGEYLKALANYDELLRDRPDALELLEGKAETLFGIGGEARLGVAMTIYRRIAGTVDAGSPSYWQAQLRMLQILERVNRNTSRIAPRIRRLQQQYPELGGDPWRRQLQALLTKYG